MGKESRHFYIGSYAPMGTAGIFSAQLDRENGQMSLRAVCDEVENPSWLTLHPDEKIMYVVEELEKNGRLAVLRCTGEKCQILQRLPAGGAPCHITMEARREYLFVSNYLSGTLGVYRLNPDGTVAEQTYLVRHSGHGLNPERQEGPHVHSTLCMGDRVFAADLGLDEVDEYRLNRTEGTLDLVRRMPVASGAGPRHMATPPGHPEILYVAGELDGCLYRLDLLSGRVEERRRIVPEDCQGEFRISSVKTAEQTLYIGCREFNAVMLFELLPDGRTGQETVYRHLYETPRDVFMDRQYAITADEGSGGLSILRRDGMALRQETFIPTGGVRPACIVPA